MRMKALFLVLSICAFATGTFAAPVELESGDLKLVLYPDSGTFNLYQLSDVGKKRYEPLLEERNRSSTTWFSVMINDRIFKLEPKAGKPVVCAQTDSGASFVYTLTDDFQAVQNFSFIIDASSGRATAIKIETFVENTSGKPASFALKALFDTSLGESEGIHFLTDNRNRISSETKIDTSIDTDSAIISKNAKLSLMFGIYGNGATRPDFVFASNWNRLNTLTWIPEFIEGRSFNTMYTINDSALLFVWPEKEIEPNANYASTVILGPYEKERVNKPKKTAVEPAPMQVPDEANRNSLIRRLLERARQIEENPESATDEELRQLNETLDVLLGRKKD